MKNLVAILICIASAVGAAAQAHQPSVAKRPFLVKTKQQISEISKEIEKQSGNIQSDIVAQAGTQMRVAVFHDDKRENDLIEVHDASDDIYYVLDGEAELLLGGSLVEPNEISTGEWRSKTSTGGQKVKIRKGDLVVVPRGTPHQRSVTGKGFSMILIKVFAQEQPAK